MIFVNSRNEQVGVPDIEVEYARTQNFDPLVIRTDRPRDLAFQMADFGYGPLTVCDLLDTPAFVEGQKLVITDFDTTPEIVISKSFWDRLANLKKTGHIVVIPMDTTKLGGLIPSGLRNSTIVTDPAFDPMRDAVGNIFHYTVNGFAKNVGGWADAYIACADAEMKVGRSTGANAIALEGLNVLVDLHNLFVSVTGRGTVEPPFQSLGPTTGGGLSQFLDEIAFVRGAAVDPFLHATLLRDEQQAAVLGLRKAQRVLQARIEWFRK